MLRSHLFRDALGHDVAAPDAPVRGIAFDSRKVRQGDVFVAVPGHKADGHAYCDDAIRLGAAALVLERPHAGAAQGVPTAVVPCARRALARLAASFHGHPGRRVAAVGVTGTKGKTTTTWLLRSIVRATGRECGVLGTVAYEAFGCSAPSDNTTPDPVAIQAFLAALDRPDGGYCALEVSSHALEQRRVDGLPFRVAAFTNLTGDHLDYHGTMDRYLEAKAILFDGLGPQARAVLNVRQAEVLGRLARTRAGVLLYGIAQGAAETPDVGAAGIIVTARGTHFRLALPGAAPRPVRLPLVGRHNVENALCAAASAFALGIRPDAIVAGLEALEAVPGRLEPVECGQPFRVLVDYAHTDDALGRALEALRPLLGAGSRLLCVFGCGGDRDRTKRPRMARAAERGSEVVVVTSDNPRTEDPGRILDDILRGFDRPDSAIVEPDRRRAIAAALLAARPGDIVLVAGKGHETYQIVGDVKHPFDDRAVCRDLLERMRDEGARRRPRSRPRPRPAPEHTSG